MSMTIGELIEILERCKPEAHVYFGFGGCFPTKVNSWRGIYAEPALGFSGGEYGKWESPTVEKLIAELRSAVDGRTYSGWKGGDYAYGLTDTLHIDNPGNSTHTELIRVERDDYAVHLHTAKEE